MNTTSASPADATSAGAGSAAPATPSRILVWDAPVRVFHWLAVACFAGAWLTSESEAWRLVHVTLGYTLAGLVVFRLAWGLVGTRHARFASFVRGPRTVLAYLRSLGTDRPAHTVGHNPAGAWAIVALLALAAVVTATGWLADAGGLGESLEELHEGAATAMLVVVGLHVAGVVLSSWKHRENLVRAMVDGHKAGAPAEGIGRARWGLAALLLAAVLGFWGLQAATAPAGVTGSGAGTGASHGEHGGDPRQAGGDKDHDGDDD